MRRTFPIVALGLIAFGGLSLGIFIAWRLYAPREPLHQAAFDGDAEEIKRLIAAGSDVNAPSSYGKIRDFRPLWDRLRVSSEEAADGNGPKAIWLWYPKMMPLQIAVAYGRRDAVDTLIRAGANPNHSVGYGIPPLMSSTPYKEIFDMLLNAGADVHGRTIIGETALHYAMWAHDDFVEEIARSLIRAGADINAKTQQGWTPLHYACRNGVRQGEKIAAVLVSAGAQLEIQDNDGRTPLALAVEHESTKVLTVLLKAGAAVNPQDKNGRTPLHAAAQRVDLPTIRALVQAGADVHAKDASGLTALSILLAEQVRYQVISSHPGPGVPPPPAPPAAWTAKDLADGIDLLRAAGAKE